MLGKPLTRATIKAAISVGVPDGRPHLMLWDARPTGLGLKLRASGSASWVFLYRPKGSPKGTPSRTVTLGAYPTMPLDDARREALKLAGKAASGGDPAADIRPERRRSRSRLSAALVAYERELLRRKVVARAEAMSSLRRGFGPMLDDEVGAIEQPQLIARISAIATHPRRHKDGTVYRTPGAAAEFRKHAHAFLAWCVSAGLTRHNALAGYRIPRQTREERLSGGGHQGKALSDAEIVKVWGAAETLGAFGGLIRLALLSGLRRNEIATLEWADLHDIAIVIPAKRSKMGREHRVPLTPLMQRILGAQPKRPGNSLVFPSPVSSGVIKGWSKLTPKLVKASGVALKIHDLRRSCRTLMRRLGIDEATAEAAIGHVKGGLVGIYDKHDLWAERVDAFARVSAHIEGLVGEADGTRDNVVVVQ